MNPSSSSESAIVRKLISQSKLLTEATIRKCENEKILRELSLFQNLSEFVSRHKSLVKVIQVEIQVFPSPLSFSSGKSSNETMIIRVQNISKNFTFHPSHWQFIIDLGTEKDTRTSSCWSLQKPLDPEKTESFASSFVAASNLSPLPVKVRARFTISHEESTFVKTLNMWKTGVDILHLLLPVRHLRTEVVQVPGGGRGLLDVKSIVNNNPQNRQKGGESDDEDEDDVNNLKDQLPPITQVFFKLNPPLMRIFLREILLKDCRSRWLSMMSEKELEGVLKGQESFPVYCLEDEIIVTPKPLLGLISFKSNNPRVLSALKVGVLMRLADLNDLVKISVPDDETSEKLYALKLRLDEFMAIKSSSSEPCRKERTELYLDLREISETIEFGITNDHSYYSAGNSCNNDDDHKMEVDDQSVQIVE